MIPLFPATTPRVELHPAIAPALPSATSALALANGDPGALRLVVAHTGLRAGIIGVGLLVAGQRRDVLKNALIASLAIEAFVVGWALWQRSQAPAVVAA